MKPILLSDEQKEKLIEMCKHFYPSLDFKIDEPPATKEISTIMFGVKESPDYTHEIHWFEFCVYHLSYKLGKEVDHYSTEVMWMNLLSSKHPVDYLYELFLTIK